MPRTAKAHPPEKTCVHCKRRKRQNGSEYCSPCRTMLIKDGVIKPKKQTFAQRYRQYVDRFNKGMTHKQIAKDLQLDISYVASIPNKAREMGWPVPTRAPRRPKITEHGAGTTGVAGCNCDPCVETRAKYKADKYRERLADRKSKLMWENPKVGHGEGSRGIEGCYCGRCVQRRKDYKKEWREDVAANGARRDRRDASVAQSGSSS